MTDTNFTLPAESGEKNKIVGGTLYLVATPIGNLADLSQRAIKVLSEVDLIAAEDTRNTMRLLQYLGINKPLVSYFEHNKRTHGQLICDRLLAGESCALVTDAGTPAISDPGEDIVALCAEKNIPVTSIPGACAAILSLTLSGLPTGRFCFEGFLPVDKKDRRERLEKLAYEDRTMIFHEAPHKLINTLEDMEKAFGGDRRISLCRELTKLNEEVTRTTLGAATEYYAEHEPRGEYVLIVEGGDGNKRNSDKSALLMLTPAMHVQHYEAEGMPKMAAIKAAAKDRGMSKSELYNILLEDN